MNKIIILSIGITVGFLSGFLAIYSIDQSTLSNENTRIQIDEAQIGSQSSNIKNLQILLEKEHLIQDTSKCSIQNIIYESNYVHAKNCDSDQINQFLREGNMRTIDTRFYNGLAIGNENIIAGDALFDAIPSWFTVKYLNGTQELWGYWNGSSIYDFYKIKMAQICQNQCANGDLP